MNSKFKRILSLLLAMVMMMSVPMFAMAEEADGENSISLFSLFPIEEVYATIDLTDYSADQLLNMTTAELFSNLKDSYDEPIEIAETATTVWSNYFDENGDYVYDTWKVLSMEDTVNVLSYYMEDNYGVEIIIGSGNQLDEENKRYFINFELPYEYAELDLTGYFYHELYNISVSELIANLTVDESPITVTDNENTKILWNVRELIANECIIGNEYEESDVVDGWFTRSLDDMVKFAPTLEERWHNGEYMWRDAEIVVVSDDNTSLLRVDVTYPEYANVFEFNLYTQDEENVREQITIEDMNEYDSRWRMPNNEYDYILSINGSVHSRYSMQEEYYFGLKLKDAFSDANIKILKDWGHKADDIMTDLEDGALSGDIDVTEQYIVTDMTIADAGVKAEWLNWCDEGKVTICFISDNGIYLEPVRLDINPNSHNVQIEYDIYKDVDETRDEIFAGNDWDWEEVIIDDYWYQTEIMTFYVEEGNSATDEYYISMYFYDGDTHERVPGASRIDKAVVGHYYSIDDVENLTDIKEQLFAEDMSVVGAGYKDNFSGEGVDFTIFSGDDMWHYTIKVAENEGYVYDGAPDVGSSDRYFQVNDLFNGDDELDTYVIPYEHDTYYSYGYQTLLINDTEADMTAIAPEVYLGYHAKVYYNDTLEETNDDNWSNKLTARDFTGAPADVTRDPQSSIRYTVSAENHIDQKNYWVTTVKKEEGAKLFVNGPDEREIFLNNYFDNAHDIFVANVGTEELTGITVTLDATNVKLDEYWTLGGEGNNTLAPFTTTYNNTGNYHGELFNVAKIRLIPDGEGEITGTLTIAADGQESRVITLTGTAGNPKIDTTSLHDAVKYVPYSAIVTTNNMHDWNKVTLELVSGKLPEGVEFYPSGEIYGVPKETGEFPITIRANYSHSEFEDSVANLTLTVQDNTDENVNATVDEGYGITIRVPDTITSYTDREFEIEGVLAEFVDFWLDGEKLVKDVDYTAEEGSTKITIKSQTFSNAGNGKHTISAEFRVDGDRNKDLKKASQNYTKSSGGGGSTGGGGGGGTASYKVTFETNGGSAIDAKTIKKGSTITDLPAPTKDGFVFVGWYKDAALTQAFDSTTKITAKTTLYAKWDVVIPEEKPVEVSGFVDVTENDWFYEDAKWAYGNELMVGYNNAQFAPNDAITGGMIVAVLARLADVDVTKYENTEFEDVYEEQWYTPYAKWAKAVGLVDGIPFNPPAEITREWMGIVLDRYLDYVKAEYVITDEKVEFADAELISDEAMEAMQTLFKLEIFRGKGNNVIDPLSNTTRAEFAALIHRVDTFLNK